MRLNKKVESKSKYRPVFEISSEIAIDFISNFVLRKITFWVVDCKINDGMVKILESRVMLDVS